MIDEYHKFPENGKLKKIVSKFDEKVFLKQSLKKNTMQFLLIAYDGTDQGAQERRMKFRPEHLFKIEKLKKAGEFLFGGAILSENGQMTGSMIVYDFPDRAALDERLKEEPYIFGKVWEKIEIKPFRLAKIEIGGTSKEQAVQSSSPLK